MLTGVDVALLFRCDQHRYHNAKPDNFQAMDSGAKKEGEVEGKWREKMEH